MADLFPVSRRAALLALALLAPACGARAVAAPKPVCHASGTLRVVSRDRVEATGQSLYAAAKPIPATAPCAFAPRPGDFVINDESAYFLALQGTMLALEVSTGPDGNLVIYDVAKRKKLVDVGYDDARPLVGTPEAFTYWRVGDAAVPAASCPAAWRAMPDNAGAKQAHPTTEVRFTIADGKATATGRTGCRLRQDDID